MFTCIIICIASHLAKKKINTSKRKSSVSIRSNENLVATVATHLEKNNSIQRLLSEKTCQQKNKK